MMPLNPESGASLFAKTVCDPSNKLIMDSAPERRIPIIFAL